MLKSFEKTRRAKQKIKEAVLKELDSFTAGMQKFKNLEFYFCVFVFSRLCLVLGQPREMKKIPFLF